MTENIENDLICGAGLEIFMCCDQRKSKEKKGVDMW